MSTDLKVTQITLTRPLRLWVIDDEEPIRESLAMHLEDFFEVRAFPFAYEAWAALTGPDSTPPDIILTDMRMPKMTGLEFLTKLRAGNFSVPVIFMSAYTDKEVLLNAVNQSIGGFIEKPFDLIEVRNRLVSVGQITAKILAATETVKTFAELKFTYQDMFKHYFERYFELQMLLESHNLTQDMAPEVWLKRLKFERMNSQKVEALEEQIKHLQIALTGINNTDKPLLSTKPPAKPKSVS